MPGGKVQGQLTHPVVIISHGGKEINMSEAIERENIVDADDGFLIDTDAKAAWALRKIREARADRDMWVQWYKQKIAEIEAATDANTANLENMLRAYFDTVPHKKTKTQESYPLKDGKLIWKVQNPEFKRDDKTVIAWLKDNHGGQFVKTKEELDWAGLKAATGVFDGNVVDENGEIIPGIVVEAREPKFIVEV